MRDRVYATVLFAFAMALIVVLPGCMDDQSKVLARTNAIYQNIRLIVTDPEVSAMIPDMAMHKLAKAERIYLEAARILENADVGSEHQQTALQTIMDCADIFLTVVDDLGKLAPQYQPAITATRLSVKLLKANIQK